MNSSQEREAVDTQEVHDGFQRFAGCPSVQETGSLEQQASILPDEKSKQVVKPGSRKKSYSRILCFFRWPAEVVVGEGEKSALKLSTGTLAKLADGAAVAQVVFSMIINQ